MIETNLLDKFLIAKQNKKSCDWITNQWINLIAHHLKCHSEIPEPKSDVKMIWCNCLPELSHTITFSNIRHPNTK